MATRAGLAFAAVVLSASAYADWETVHENVQCVETRLVSVGAQRDPIGRPAYPIRVSRDLPMQLENFSDRIVFIAEALTDSELETVTDEERLDVMLVSHMLDLAKIAVAKGRRVRLCVDQSFPRSQTSAINGKRRYPVVRLTLLDT